MPPPPGPEHRGVRDGVRLHRQVTSGASGRAQPEEGESADGGAIAGLDEGLVFRPLALAVVAGRRPFRSLLAGAMTVGLNGACAGAPPPTTAPPMVNLAEAGASNSPGAAETTADVSTSLAEPDSGQAAPKCTGRATLELEAAALNRAVQARRCYRQALVLDPTLRGKMLVTVRISEDGSVTEHRVVSSDMPAAMNDCVVQILRQPGYAPPLGGCLDVTVPLAFLPRDDGAPAPLP